ncbi:MAG: DUF4301 family protein, partial [Alistipes sp.]
MFTETDLLQIKQHGLTVEAVERQLKNFEQGFPFLKLTKAASPDDGIRVLSVAEIQAAVARYEQAAQQLRIVKFVPAS